MITRRHFLQNSTGTAAALMPAFMSAAGTARPGKRPAPSGRVTLALIGAGSQGTTDMRNFLQDERVQVVATCDVEKESDRYNKAFKGAFFGREPARRIVNKHYGEQDSKSGGGNFCEAYEDFRDVLARKDIDAVLIATPDHWHVPISVLAARAGKHIYCEKPVSLSVAEGRFLCTEIERAGVRFQTGSQQRSDIHFRMACEFVRNGRLGKIKRITVGLASHNRNNNGCADQTAPTPVPAGLNYDLWLGPCAADLPFCPARLHSNWRWLWAHGGGNVTDFGAHHLDIVQWALGMDEGGPVDIFNPMPQWPAPGSFYQTPELFSFQFRYASGIEVTVTDGDANPSGVHFEGENGTTLFVKRGSIKTNPADLLRQSIKPEEVHLYESKSHSRNLIDCILEKKQTICPPEIGHRSATIAHLGNIALKLGRGFKWNPETEKIDGNDEAMAMLTRPMRAPWNLM